MSETDKSAQPALSDDIQELQGKFPSDAAMQDAMSKLELAGFDHADLSFPDPNAPATPDAAAAATDDIDKGQIRNMASGMTGVAAGMAAGAVVATGGLAAPVAAAIGGAAALGTTLATAGVGTAVDKADSEARDRLAAEGKLILAVRTPTPEKRAKAEAALREAGATELFAISDPDQAKTGGYSATSWTGA